jgi:ribose 5-phosphate isomerase B
MKIAIGSDHRGYRVKEDIKVLLGEFGHECIDVGSNNDGPSDYPDMAYVAAKAVSEGQVDRAILVCATGIGMCIAANKIMGVRAALCHDELSAVISRDHNDANILCLSGDQIGEVLLRKIVAVWLDTPFSKGRHLRRVNKIRAIEDGRDPRQVTGE